MTSTNQDQIDFWNADGGRRWTEEQAHLDALIAVFGEAALEAAAATPGEKVIDIGCGCGATTLALGQAVGAAGEALGVDVSAPMLARARERALETGASNVRFEEADASAASLPRARDLLFSRFGVMFFAEPTAAFTHLRGALKPGGRMAFACWRAFAENPWALVPVMAGVQAIGTPPPRPDPHAPGPFAFADASRLRAILVDAGFSEVAIEAFDAPMRVGADVADAAARSLRLGPLAALVRESGGAGIEKITAAVAEALKPYATPEGVILPGATWIVTARSA